MNKRIKELWELAGGYYNSGNQHTWPQYTIDNPEKLAELIVREAIDDLRPELTEAEVDGVVERFFSQEAESFDD